METSSIVLLAHSVASPLGGFPRQRVAGVLKGLSEEVSSSVYTPRPVVATAADLKELALAPDGGTGSLVNILFFVALGLLLVVSVGILYLSSVKWRDRRLQKRDKKSG